MARRSRARGWLFGESGCADCKPMEAVLNPRTTQHLELPEEANHTKKKKKRKVGSHAEHANLAEPTNPSDAARVGSSWGKEHDGDSACGATETKHCHLTLKWQRAQPTSPETGKLRRHFQRAQVADNRVNAQTKVNASTAAGPSRTEFGISIIHGKGGAMWISSTVFHEPSDGRSRGCGLGRGGARENSKEQEVDMVNMNDGTIMSLRSQGCIWRPKQQSQDFCFPCAGDTNHQCALCGHRGVHWVCSRVSELWHHGRHIVAHSWDVHCSIGCCPLVAAQRRCRQQNAKKERRARNRKRYYEENKEKILEKLKRRRAEQRAEQREEAQRRYDEQNKEKIREKRRGYFEKNKEKIKEKNRLYYDENKEWYQEYNRRYREKNKEKLKEYFSQYYKNNKEKRLECERRYREKNKEKRKEYQSQYREKNKEKMKEYQSQYREKNKEKIKEMKRLCYEKKRDAILDAEGSGPQAKTK